MENVGGSMDWQSREAANHALLPCTEEIAVHAQLAVPEG